MEVRPHSCYFLTSSYTSLPVQNSHTTESNLGQGVVSFSDWIVCWHFTQCEPCQGCVCVCVCVSRCVLLILSSWSDWFPGHVLSIRMSGVIDLKVCVCVLFFYISLCCANITVSSPFFFETRFVLNCQLHIKDLAWKEPSLAGTPMCLCVRCASVVLT